ncbi:conserved membrane hypothetical protein [Candidatus Desulfosporosinus infrequens]|uniref:DUF1634 domain-containing protein n=1 Tax=Candidatus Desulfosporosinus infrequens TaxID=2043169 RepID=A0A2U3LRN1_9FIRM|nr:conserved membrane hypothetical protein [Candidatus Desulfosporosinus infrequens]
MINQSSVQSNTHGTQAKSVISEQSSALTSSQVSPEQNRYASILLVCSWGGIILMLVTFLLYMGGLFNPTVQPSEIPLYWGLSVHKYALATHAPSGWNWVTMINHADYLNLIGLAFLGSVSVIGYISLLKDYVHKKDLPYVIMVALEIIVIVSAASGIFNIPAGG